MEKEKNIIVGQDIDVEPAVLHQIPIDAFMVLKNGETGEKKEVNMRKVVGSKEKNKENI